MKNCWELRQCGREKESAEASQCIIATSQLGHSCFTFSALFPELDDRIKPSCLEGFRDCTGCAVFNLYDRRLGQRRDALHHTHGDEEHRVKRLLLQRLYEAMSTER